MKRLQKCFLAVFFLLSLSSCVVQAPKYAKVEQVLLLHLGMSKEDVSKALNIPPYDIKSVTDSNEVLIYKYRVTDRKTVPFMMKPTNGIPVRGKFVDLFVTYSKEGKVTGIESCSDCEETTITKKQLDINKLITLITVTLPVILVYIGLKSSP